MPLGVLYPQRRSEDLCEIKLTVPLGILYPQRAQSRLMWEKSNCAFGCICTHKGTVKIYVR